MSSDKTKRTQYDNHGSSSFFNQRGGENQTSNEWIHNLKVLKGYSAKCLEKVSF